MKDLRSAEYYFGYKTRSRFKEYQEYNGNDRQEIIKDLIKKFWDTEFISGTPERGGNYISMISNLTRKDDEFLVPFYEKILINWEGSTLNDENFKNKEYEVYTILEPYAKLLGKKIYPKFLDIIENKSQKINKDKSIIVECLKQICRLSGINFFKNFTYEQKMYASQIQDEYLPMKELKRWQQAGYPNGNDFKNFGKVYSKLTNTPENEIDENIQRIYLKLKRKGNFDDPIFQLTTITKPNCDLVKKLIKKYDFADDYKYFLVNYDVNGFESRDYLLLGSSELEKYQLGFSVDDKGIMLEGWDQDMVVIAMNSLLGDPVTISLKDGKIYTSSIGMGAWKYTKVKNNFTKFLSTL